MKVKCPKCGNESSYIDNPFRPFCGERCKLLDLGDWLSGSYRVPSAPGGTEDAKSESDGETEEP